MILQLSRIAAVLKGAFGFVTANRDPVTGGIKFNAVEITGYKPVEIAYDLNSYYSAGDGSKSRLNGFKSSLVSVAGQSGVRITASITGGATALAVFFSKTGAFLGAVEPGIDGEVSHFDRTVVPLPVGTHYIGLTQRLDFDSAVVEIMADAGLPSVQSDIHRLAESYETAWAGKKIVWFGTSIPEGGGIGSYPVRVGGKLGALVINEAVGSSMVRNGVAASRTAQDLYGWSGLAWQNVAYSLSATLAEKQYLIDNWATVRLILSNSPPVTLPEWEVSKILDCSWENKLARHLGDNRADLYVFDHGHNDHTYVTGGAADVVTADSRDRGTFSGAVAYLIDKILADNLKAKICFVGHYENKVEWKTQIVAAQKNVAEMWSLPLIPMWEKLGWTQQQITSGGVTKTVTEWWMPDNLHPHSDPTGAAIERIADVLTPMLRDVR